MTVISTALRSLRRNLMRSILTTLGIVIGISAVITMFALGEGAQKKVEQQIENLGTNVLMVRAASKRSSGAKSAAGASNTLELKDAVAIKDNIMEVVAAGASVKGQAQVVSGNQNWNTSVEGANVDYLIASNRVVAEGRTLTDADMTKAAKVALIGQTVAQELFGSASFALGEMIRVNKVPLTVVGLLESKGQDIRGEDQDDIVIVPISTANRKVIGSKNINRVSRLTISVEHSDDLQYVTEEISALLDQRHRVAQGQPSPFMVMNLTEMLSTRAETNAVFAMLLAGVAGVSLLVGGIGVMNIMLVSVTERTREIGLRMAVGAQPKHILWQFLIESVILCLIGATIGLTLSVISVVIMQYGFGWTMILSPTIILISVIGTTFIGIGFGFYPAYKASQLDPIEALRYE
ncbi:FtsX-like permease family protein [Vibrio sp. SM6]|uniref:FtsX-like permease family protein n=1 Tax=Vibrio agarilyticus TaxID=2726741 RepID=A0A7X8TQ90_9VIBR|nr:ABC transporter permease [Vibrio agarilyticus]NLS12676.1 FtsX-like permease family protein [Vibrio agarilyticus]